MAKVRISKEEIEKMLKDQLKVQEVVWKKNGDVEVEIDVDKLKKKKVKIIKETEIIRERYPFYVDPWPYRRWPIWYVNKPSMTGDKYYTLTYSSTKL